MELKIKGNGKKCGLLKMLAWIELCGNIGHTPKGFKVFADGDGCTRWKFDFDDEDIKKQYNEYKNKFMKENVNNGGSDIEWFDI